MKRIFTDIQDFGDDDGDSDDEAKDKYKKFRAKTSSIIFLIDARKKMFLPSNEDNTIPFLRCLECLKNVIRQKIFRLEKIFCGVIFLGTKKSNNQLNLNNITVVQELKILGAEHVLKIDEIVNDVEMSNYEKQYGFDNFSLGDVFWLSAHMFNTRSRDNNKTLILFTNDDNPVSNDKNDLNRALANAQDMLKNFITFDLIHLGKQFDVNKFYKEIVQTSKQDMNFVIPDPVTEMSEMIKRVSKTNYRHVSLTKLPFVIFDDFIIKVSVHFLVRKAKVPHKITLSKSTNERVFTRTQNFEAETGSLVRDENIIKSQFVGQKDVNFKLGELKTISDYGSREIKLLGFKPATAISLENFVKPCAFIYPDDSDFKGSSTFFTALMKRCISKQVIPICTFYPRTTSTCRFVALIAQDEVLRPDKSQEFPPGFIVFFLPFAEEVRAFDENPTERAEPEIVDIAVKLVKKLKFNYKPECFQNPKIKSHWAAIEALALDLKEPEEVNDCTIPNYELISQRTEKIAKEFIENVYPDHYQPECFATSRKPRPMNLPKSHRGENINEVEELVRAGKGERLANEVLKKYLISVGDGKGLSKLKKSDLIEKVRTKMKLN